MWSVEWHNVRGGVRLTVVWSGDRDVYDVQLHPGLDSSFGAGRSRLARMAPGISRLSIYARTSAPGRQSCFDISWRSSPDAELDRDELCDPAA